MDQKHRQAVKSVQEQVVAFHKQLKPFRVYHGSTNSTRVLNFKRDEIVDISSLNRVIKINERKLVAIVEPNVAMDKLVNETLKYGLIPPVVTEFPGITVGGGIQGAAAENASFKWGCLSQTTNWVELVLANGHIIRVSPSQNSDLFYGMAGSCGTLGLITAAEIKLIPVKKYVVLTYYPVSTYKEALKLITKYAKSGCDFIECNFFAKDCGTVMIGNLSDMIEGKIRKFSRAIDPWFYMHASKIAKQRKVITETLLLKDYLFRHDRGAFWGGKLAFEYFGVPFNKLTRFVLNPILHTRKLYQALQESAAAQMYICQDFTLPAKSTLEFLEFIDQQFSLYPVGIWALKPAPRSPFLPNGIKDKLVFNVGVYGLKVVPYKKFVETNKLVESQAQKLGGKKWFYAHSYYSEKEFWQIYDRNWYHQLRAKYHADHLPTIYDKIRVKDQFEINSKRALRRTIFGRNKLRTS